MTTTGHPTSPSPRSRPAPRSRPRLTRNVAPGVHRLEHAHVNLYLIDDRRLAAHPYRYRHERSRLLYPVAHPRCVPVIGAMTRAGALRVKGVPFTETVPESGTLDVPGRPQVVRTPGHTDGHIGLHLPERDALLTGDALVTLDPYTGLVGPQIVAGAATSDSSTALRSLDALAATGARIVLPGHGEPLRTGIRAAVEAARAAGAH
ncbi:MBL fold metallo-hydrolase [Herbiconiux sp. VKM Ac-1786]|uniref:MBL fold metallo-hydrolase n=1 Tax=Herbiconiux sp. VKM Ac-1786 TaxID=2783824 RepID=UPI00188C185B|nr:MBL fold metallo-hydrolase [Herbiconiux sp. VKM Ac-1786]MBF4573891.1 MBL fold metallo-hydrolase [Herbiconiux sp. VKM Ac-1786]